MIIFSKQKKEAAFVQQFRFVLVDNYEFQNRTAQACNPLAGILMTRQLILILLFFGLTSCHDQTPSDKMLIKDCGIESFIIDSVSCGQSTMGEINEPSAIEFFHLSNAIRKQGDSLPKKLLDNMTLVHSIDDQFGAYSALVKPKLDSLKVKIIAADFTDSLMTFNFRGNRYTISIGHFKDNDGVILYKPGKKPILWTLDRAPNLCKESEFIDSYFSGQ